MQSKHGIRKTIALVVLVMAVLATLAGACARDVQEMGVTNLSSLHLSDTGGTATPVFMADQQGLGAIAVFEDAGTPVASIYDGGASAWSGAASLDSTLGVAGAVDFDTTLNVDGASQFNSMVSIDHVGATDGMQIDIVDASESGYTDLINAEWTAGAATTGGSNGIYVESNPIEDVSNAYALRGRTDMRGQDSTGVSVNQLHAVDALVNMSDQVYTVTDNISVFGAAVHSVDITAGDIVPASDAGTLNLFYGVWGDSMLEDFTGVTNGVLIMSHAGTYLDNGMRVANSGAMNAGLRLDNHTSNSPATMAYGVEMISAADKMTNGIYMATASFSDQDIVFQNGTGLSEETDTVLTFSEFLAAEEQTAEVVSAGSTIVATGTYQPLTSAAAVTTSTSTAIADGTKVGQLLILVNENASDAITIDDAANTRLSGNAVLGNDDSLMLIWDGADWLEIGQVDTT